MAVGGTQRSGTCVRASGGSVAHSAAAETRPAAGLRCRGRRGCRGSAGALPGHSRRPQNHRAVPPCRCLGDVAQADNGVAGLYTSAPLLKQMLIHLVGAPEGSVPRGQRHPVVRQVKVSSTQSPFSRFHRLKPGEKKHEFGLQRASELPVGGVEAVRGPEAVEPLQGGGRGGMPGGERRVELADAVPLFGDETGSSPPAGRAGGPARGRRGRGPGRRSRCAGGAGCGCGGRIACRSCRKRRS